MKWHPVGLVCSAVLYYPCFEALAWLGIGKKSRIFCACMFIECDFYCVIECDFCCIVIGVCFLYFVGLYCVFLLIKDILACLLAVLLSMPVTFT